MAVEDVGLAVVGLGEVALEVVGLAEAVSVGMSLVGAVMEKAAEKEREALLDGEADSNDTFLEINSGAGGKEELGSTPPPGAHHKLL